MANTGSEKVHYFLDITSDRCPMTFVKTRLKLDQMQSGEKLEVRLCGAEPLTNVPRSAREIGCTVSEPEWIEGEVYKIVLEKK